MKPFLILIAFILGSTINAFAIPAFPLPFKVKQPDGSELTVRLIGDEHFHYYLNVDNGEKLLAQKDGTLFKASDQMLSELMEKGNEARQKVNEQRGRRAARHRVGSSTTGNKRGLVILVNYQDVAMGSTHGQERWNRQFNEEGYGNNGHIGSVRDYFIDQSFGQLTIDFDVVGPYTLSKERAYYGSSEGAYSGGNDAHPCEMVAEACQLADEDVDYSNYDWDGDGEVDQVFVVYAGGGEHAGAGSDCIWPHEFYLSGGGYQGDGNGALHLDGVRIDTYAVSCEKYFTTSSMDAIGAACHEFSHCLGLMDIYDTSYSGNYDMDDWDVLSSGSYNGSNFRGNTPCGYTAFERFYVGWMDIKELTDTEQITDMPALNDEPVAYCISNPGNENEFFVLENRQNSRWFQYPGNSHGLMIYHIDWDNYAWWTNTMNSGDHSRISIVPADGDYDNSTSSDYQGDLFPGSKKVTLFDDYSHEKCGGKLFSKNNDGSYYLHNYVSNITETDGKISFKFKTQTILATPVLEEPTLQNDSSYRFSWSEVDKANSYALVIKRIAPLSSSIEKPAINEDFNKLTTDNTTDISDVISKALNSDGWSGYHVYSSKQRVRIGTQVANGYLQTPLLHTDNGEFTINITLKKIGNAEVDTYVQAINADGVIISQMSLNNEGTPELSTFSVSDMQNGGDCYLRFNASTRIYIDSLAIYNGCWYDDSQCDSINDQNLDEDMWKWGDEKVFSCNGDKCFVDITDAADIPGYGYYRCQAQALAEDGSVSQYSNPVYIINKRPVEDAIRNVTFAPENKLVYNLQGQQVSNPEKGLFIRNGKKFLVK